MRIALITIGGDADDASAERQAYLGRSLALRQLDFAVAVGCDAAIGLGEGAGAEATELRHAAEKRGMKFRTMGNTHNLLGAIGTGDELLVLAPDLLPESSAAAEILKKRQAVVVLPAETGVAAGFERIDANCAWAGALLMPGRLVEHLAQLPRECDAAAALLRITLQAGVETRPLAQETLADGRWIMTGPTDAEEIDRRLLERRLPRRKGMRPSQWLALVLLRHFAPAMLRRNAMAAVLQAGVVVFAAGACAFAIYGHPAVGLLVTAACALLGELSIGFVHLRQSPLLPGGLPGRLAGWGRWAVDAALLFCAASAIGAAWQRDLFPPLVLLLALHALALSGGGGLRAIICDRAIVGVLLCIGALLGYAEHAAMLLALISLGMLVIRWTPRGTS